MKIKREDVYTFFNVVGNAEFDLPITSNFRYNLSKNLKIAQEEMADTDKLFPAPDGYEDYHRERVGIFGKYGIRTDKYGNANMDDIGKMDAEKAKELKVDLDKLMEVNSEILDKVETLNKEKIEFLKEEIDLPFRKIDLAQVPTISEKHENHWAIWSSIEKVMLD